jgi:hypothetical protein
MAADAAEEVAVLDAQQARMTRLVNRSAEGDTLAEGQPPARHTITRHEAENFQPSQKESALNHS